MKLINLLLLSIGLFLVTFVNADEGMWLPQLLQKLNEKEMKSLGMKINASDIYSINKGSLKDAIVSFGGFCTGDIISSRGLVLTNHHCGFGSVQNHSTLEHNYIKDGFWAKNQGEEIPNPGLFVTFIIRIEDVSKEVMKGVLESMAEPERQSAIDKNIADIRKVVRKESYQDDFIRGFFEGNKYYLFITETFRDVRLVGAPPSSIGNFGQDTDNWMWPRHTGDFSLFRIYAGKNNKPAEYSPENIPYTPRKSLSISLDGVSEGDFTMVFGFPGRTMQYIPSVAVDQIMRISDPAKIKIREIALGIMDGFMRRDEQIKIQYAAKYAAIANAWKKWQGEVLGLTKSAAVEKKKAYEAIFQKRVEANPAWKKQYSTLLEQLDAAYKDIEPLSLARDYINEVVSKIELFTIIAQIKNLSDIQEKNGEAGFKEAIPKIDEKLKSIYQEYNAEVDKRLFASLLEIFTNGQQPGIISPLLTKTTLENGLDFNKLSDKIYNSSHLDEGEITLEKLSKQPAELIKEMKNDSAYLLYRDIIDTYINKVSGRYSEIQNRINQLQRIYMKAQLEVFKEKKFYPDANSTMRVTYGKVKGYVPRDAVNYQYYTYLKGVMEKYKPGDYEFDVPEKLRTLYLSKDYGPYGIKEKSGDLRMPVCFIATNHTTGGNSGSAALDAYGNLVGLNFDRAWEGTMSDINYDPTICRNIMVDVRYILFIIDKYAGAGYLLKEMKLVNPKNKKRY